MIGLFDSGLGGLSVWLECIKLLPDENYVYFSDSKNCPYGNKPIEFIQKRSIEITDFLIAKGADIIVCACNTATAAVIDILREKYTIPFVGIEPAIKSAVFHSNTGVVGILATANTLKGVKYHNTLERFASNIEVIEEKGTGLVEFVERGEVDSKKVETLLYSYLKPMMEKNIDSLVLGCTHYPFLINPIIRIVGPNVIIINPAPAVAQQTKRLLEKLSADPKNYNNLNNKGNTDFYTNGDVELMKKFLKTISKNEYKIYNLTKK
ncbi:MAG: glutamate racemase [Bacteroidales bacterium]